MTEEQLELFDQFHRGQLPGEKAREFEARLQVETDLRETFDRYLESIASLEREGIREDLGVIMEKDSRGLRLSIATYATAAAITGLLLITYFFWPDPMTPEELFLAHFAPYPNNYQSRSGEVGGLANALISYSEHDYELALKAISALELDDASYFYAGNCYMALKQPADAVKAFAEVPPGSVYFEQAGWYTALAFLQQNEVDSALVYLNRIEEGQYKYEVSTIILEELE